MGRTMPDLPAMQRAHDEFTGLLRSEGVDVILVDKAAPGAMKQIYTRDSVIAFRRRHRDASWRGGCAAARSCGDQGAGQGRLPDPRHIHGSAVFEGGGFAFIDAKTAVCTVSIACNPEGVRQVESILAGLGVTLIKVPMPGYRIHIDGAFIMVDVETAIVNVNELPYPFIEYLQKRGIKLDRAPARRQRHVAQLCLAVAPGRVIMHGSRSQRSVDRLDAAGITVLTCNLRDGGTGGGGLHCSTAPLIRDPI